MVAFTRSRRIAFPCCASPARKAFIASVNSASRNRGSRRARAAIVSLKSRVRAMFLSSSMLSPALVVVPALPGRGNRRGLPFLAASAQEDYHAGAVLAEIDPIARSEVDLPFVNAAADPFHVREVPRSNAVEGCGNLCRRSRVQTIKPVSVGRAPLRIQIPDEPTK